MAAADRLKKRLVALQAQHTNVQKRYRWSKVFLIIITLGALTLAHNQYVPDWSGKVVTWVTDLFDNTEPETSVEPIELIK